MATAAGWKARPTSAPLLGEPLPVELMNTVWADREGIHDALAEPDDARAWLSAVGDRLVLGADIASWASAAPAEEAADVLSGLRTLRDAARALAARRTSDPRESGHPAVGGIEAVAEVNALASAAPEWPALAWPDGEEPEVRVASPARPGHLALAHLARETVRLLGGREGDDLRACLAPGCVLYFVRHHPRREWCSDTCGNRARQARHYQRHRA